MQLTKLTAVMLCFTLLTGCSSEIFTPQSSVAEVPDRSADRYDIDAVKERADAFRELWTYQDKETEVEEEIRWLLQAVDEAFAVYSRAEIDYYLHWDDDALADFDSKTYEDYCVVSEIAAWTFVQGHRKSGYRKLFEPYVDEAWSDYYLANTLARVMGSARTSASSSNDLLDEYYEAAYSDEGVTEDVELECAEIYLDTLQGYDLSDCLYDVYGRDYSAEQASVAYHAALEQLVPVYLSLADRIASDPRGLEIYSDSFQKTDPYDILKEYAPKIMPELEESVQKLFDGALYTEARGDSCYDGSYTVALTNEQNALMYTYLNGTYYDLTTVVHEFGHFNASWREQTPVYMQTNCSDIAEIQSQGLEMLFTQFYPEIYGEDAAFMEINAIYNILDSIISGLAVGEFEYQVMQNAEDMTPQEVADLFNEIGSQCDLGRSLSEITHLYEQPGYYVSYGVSALCAAEIYCIMQENPSQALDIYRKITKIPSLSGERQFSEATAACGFRDVFDPEVIATLAEQFSERVESLT